MRYPLVGMPAGTGMPGVGVLSASMVVDSDRRKALPIPDVDIPAVLAPVLVGQADR